MEFIDIADAQGGVAQAQWLAKAEPVHRQLRESLPADYARRMGEILAAGARMTVLAEDGAVRAVAVWRIIENTYEGRRFYVDDLVTDSARRSQGYGARLLGELGRKAAACGCDVLALDSGTQRKSAHKFYFHAGMHIRAFCFRKDLK